MIDFTTNRSMDGGEAASGRLSIGGEMTVHHAIELKTALLEAFAEGEELQLDLKTVMEVDLAGLQIICAAHLGAALSGKGFSVSGAEAGAFAAARKAAGLSGSTRCPKGVGVSCCCVEVGSDG